MMVNNISAWWFFALPLWKMMEFVSWDDYSHILWTKKTCSRPPTRYNYPFFWCSLETSEVFDRHHMYLLEENPNFPMCLWLKDLKDGMPDPEILVVWYIWGHPFWGHSHVSINIGPKPTGTVYVRWETNCCGSYLAHPRTHTTCCPLTKCRNHPPSTNIIIQKKYE